MPPSAREPVGQAVGGARRQRAEPILENGMYLGRPVDLVIEQLDEATRPLFARAE